MKRMMFAVMASPLTGMWGCGLTFNWYSVCPSEFTASLAGPGNVSGLEKFFQRFSAEARDHLRVGDAFDAPEFLEAEEARAVAHERGPVEVENHFAFLRAQGRLGEGRLGVALEERAVAGDGEAVEETVEAKRPGAGGEVEKIGAG
jgi:hypothetical protein